MEYVLVRFVCMVGVLLGGGTQMYINTPNYIINPLMCSVLCHYNERKHCELIPEDPFVSEKPWASIKQHLDNFCG